MSIDSTYQLLIDNGIVTNYDVTDSEYDDVIIGHEPGGIVRGGNGDDILVGVDGVANTFYFTGWDDHKDEGRHVDIVRNFEFNEDTLSFYLGGAFFKGDTTGEVIDQGNGSRQGEFSSARDFADLMLHLNTQNTGEETAALDFAAEPTLQPDGTVSKEDMAQLRAETTDGSFVKVVGDTIVMNFDDGNHKGEGVDRLGNYRTDDIMIAFDGMANAIGSSFANELGYEGEFQSKQDSLHIAPTDGGTLKGKDGDNLFILSNGVDQVNLERGFNNNDESKHVNIVHGFDLTEDKLFFSADPPGTLPGGTNNGKFKAYEGATGLAELLTLPAVSDINDANGDLHFDIQLKSGDPLTVVLTDVTLSDIQEAAADQIWSALNDSELFAPGEIPPPTKNQDGIILNGNGGGKGDDVLFDQDGVNTFSFDSRGAAEDGTGGTNDGDSHVKVVVGFGEDDSLSFRIDGGYFKDGNGDKIPQTTNGNQATFDFDEIDELAAFINTKGGQNEAFYDADTNSTILTIDDSPGATNEDDFTIVLWDSGDLLA